MNHIEDENSAREMTRASSPASEGRPSVAHTLGPFTVRRAVDRRGGGYDYGIGTEIQGEMVCLGEAFEVVGIGIRAPAAANARLWAAADDLLAALYCLVGPAESGEHETAVENESPVTIRCELGDLRRAWAAIAAATDGKSPAPQASAERQRSET